MRWFKHYSDNYRGRSVEHLYKEFGHKGISWYYLLSEICTEKIERKPWQEFGRNTMDFCFGVGFVTKALRGNITNIEKFLRSGEDLGLWTYKIVLSELHLNYPILWDLLDSDSKRARSRRDTDTTLSRLDRDKDIEIDKEQDKDVDNIVCIDLKKSKPSRSAKALPRGCIPALSAGPIVVEMLGDVTHSCQEAWIAAYEDITWIVQEILKANAWIQANPKKKPKNFQKFMTNWLSNGFETYRKGIPSTRKTASQINADAIVDMWKRVDSGEL